jgi:hypothetical protein
MLRFAPTEELFKGAGGISLILSDDCLARQLPMEIAQEEGVIQGRKLRVDTTVVETNPYLYVCYICGDTMVRR